MNTENSSRNDEVNAHDQSLGHIDLEKLPNTRDLSYLTLTSGQHILPRRLIRSGALAEASAADINTLLERYEVQTVIDLRAPIEREKNPSPQDKMPGVQFIDVPILGSSVMGVTREGGLAGMVKTLSSVKSDPGQLMCKLYSEMLLGERGIQGYSYFFEILLNTTEGAVLWHCSAGKDRAGLASFLLLWALGFSQEVITMDYLGTNRFLAERVDDLKKLVPEGLLSEEVIESLKVFNVANEAFLNTGIKGIEKEYGTVDVYLKEALGVDEEAREMLSQKYLSQ